MSRMRRHLPALTIVLVLTFRFSVVSSAAAGALVVVGGGATDAAIVSATLALAGGRNAIVAVLPQSSELADAGASSVEVWKTAGAKEARKVLFDDRAAARRAIESATLIWMPGGDQNRFMKEIAGTGLDDLIRARSEERRVGKEGRSRWS